MIDALLRLVGVDLQRQLAQLRAKAEDFKDRTTDEMKRQAADAGLTMGLAFVGVIFAMWTVLAGLIALYLWVAEQKDPFVALGAVGLVTAVLAALLFTIVSMRGSRPDTKQTRPIDFAASAAATPAFSAETNPAFAAAALPPNASILDVFAHTLTDRTAAATGEVLDSAADIVRRGPREAMLVTLAVAALVGVMLGRRRKAED
jgi:hypothetical protein